MTALLKPCRSRSLITQRLLSFSRPLGWHITAYAPIRAGRSQHQSAAVPRAIARTQVHDNAIFTKAQIWETTARVPKPAIQELPKGLALIDSGEYGTAHRRNPCSRSGELVPRGYRRYRKGSTGQPIAQEPGLRTATTGWLSTNSSFTDTLGPRLRITAKVRGGDSVTGQSHAVEPSPATISEQRETADTEQGKAGWFWRGLHHIHHEIESRWIE